MSQPQKTQAKDLHLPLNFVSYQSLDDSPYIFDATHHLPQLFAIPSYISHSPKLPTSNSIQIFKVIKDYINQLSSQKTTTVDKINDTQFDKQLQHTKTITSLTNQLSFYRESLTSSQKKLKQSQQAWQKSTKDTQNKHRKQIKKYIDLLNDKQTQIQNLKKSIKSQTNRLLNQTNEIQTLNQLKINLENTILKSIQTIKSNIKQLNYTLQQNQLDKVVLQGKYKQLCDKIQQLIKQSQDLQTQKNKLQKKYQLIKQYYQLKKNQSLQLKFEIERYKIKLKDLTNDKSHHKYLNPSTDLQHQQTTTTLTTLKQNSFDLISKIKLINDSIHQLQQIQNINEKIKQLLNQNDSLKLQLRQKQIQIDQLQLTVQGHTYQDKLLKTRNSSLYHLLESKKTDIQLFQSKILQLQNKAIKAQQLLQKNANEYLNTIQLSHFQSTASQSNQVTKPKLKIPSDEYQQLLQIQKLKIITRQRQHYQKQKQKDKKQYKQLQQKYDSLKKQNQKLTKQTQQLQKQKKKYKDLFIQLNQSIQFNKKDIHKNKPKQKCFVCGEDLNSITRCSKCTKCQAKFHKYCKKNHQCDHKNTQTSHYSSQIFFD